MRYLIFALLLSIALYGCEDENRCPPTKVGDTIILSDGTSALLSAIAAHRCPCDVICSYAGYIGLIITVGSDTILSVSDVTGHEFAPNPDDIQNDVYYTRRGDQIILIETGEPSDSCPGRVEAEDFCLRLEVL